MTLLMIDCSKLLGFRLSGSASAAKAGVKVGIKPPPVTGL